MSKPPNFYDFIIVGAGAAGSVIAARLSEDADARVLVVEAGPAVPPPESAYPPVWPTLVATEWNWGDSSTIQTATGRATAVPRGRGVGGSSTINGMIFTRGHPASYTAWDAAGAKGWGYDDLLPYFKRSESASGHDPDLRGTHGPIVVAPADPLNALHAAALSAAVKAGYPRATDISGGLEVGFGPVDLTIVNHKRQTAADAYLSPALKRPNLELVTHAVVKRLLLQGGRCVGVEYATGAGRHISRAMAPEVILTAGAVGSAQLLMESGIGPHSHLREVGVDVRLDLPGVGANLQDHSWAMVAYRATRAVPAGQNNHGEVLGSIHSNTSNGAPDLQIIFSDSTASEFVGFEGLQNGYAIGVCLMQPFSRGSVRLSALDPRPVIDPNYFGDDRDMRTMIDGLKIAREIGNTSPLDGWRAEEVSPGPDVADEQGLREFVKRNSTSYTHLVGTCAMGDTTLSVVDSQLRVHGIEGIRIADASVMPTVPSSNIIATVYAIAERAADLITNR